MYGSLLIYNASLVNEGSITQGHVWVKEGRIAGIYTHQIPPEVLEEADILDATGKYLLPGVIDDQVHFREPGLTEKADIASESKAGIAGGVTSFMEMPNTKPPTVTQEALEEKYRLAAGKSWANYSFYMGTTNSNAEEVLKTDPRTVCGIKIFMGASTGNMLVDDNRTLTDIFRHTTLPVAVHCEHEPTIQANLAAAKAQYGDAIPFSHHPLIRSEEACYRSSAQAVELATRFGTRLHLFHLSTARELSLLSNRLPLEEKKITGEVCLHHLWFTDRDYDRLGALIKWNPAIKTEADREALREAVRNNTLDVVATDHAPHLLSEKAGNYLQAPSGGPLLQHSLPAMLEMVQEGVFDLPHVITKMCHHPAILFNIEKRGFLREGYWADLVLVNLNAPWQVTKENILYKCGWSPLEGNTFRARITHTFVNGQLIYENGTFSEPGHGQRLIFEREG